MAVFGTGSRSHTRSGVSGPTITNSKHKSTLRCKMTASPPTYRQNWKCSSIFHVRRAMSLNVNIFGKYYLLQAFDLLYLLKGGKINGYQHPTIQPWSPHPSKLALSKFIEIIFYNHWNFNQENWKRKIADFIPALVMIILLYFFLLLSLLEVCEIVFCVWAPLFQLNVP